MTDPLLFRAGRVGLPAGASRVAVLVVLVASVFAGRTALSAAVVAEASIAFIGVTVIDGSGRPPARDQTVLTEGHRIVAVRPASEVRIPVTALRVDGRGRFLIPGLWDMHAHLAKSGADSLGLFVANGVTAVRDMGGDFEQIARWRSEIEAGTRTGPLIRTPGRILEAASNVRRMKDEGTVEPVDRFRLPVATPADAVAAVESQARAGVDFLKVRTVESPEVFHAMAAAARQRGLSLTGHPVVPVPEMAGTRPVRSIEHILMPGFDQLTAEQKRRTIEQVRASGVVFVPTMVVRQSVFASMDTAATLLSDATGDIEPLRRPLSGYLIEDWREQIAERAGDPYKGFDRLVPGLLANIRALHDAGVRVLPGTDTAVVLIYPGASLHDELALMVSEIGFTPMEALVAATRHPAEYFGVQRELGTITPGKRADLVLLSRDPLSDIRNTRSIEAVVANGRLLMGPALVSLHRDTAAQATQASSQVPAIQELREAIKGKESLPAEQVFKNIQLLKGMPVDRLLRVMEFGYSRSLGVDCTHCHVPGAWESDDKPTKRIARGMIRMTTTINVEQLRAIGELKDRNPVVNCGTCHRGQARPSAN